MDDRFADLAEAAKVVSGPLRPDERALLEAEVDALVAKAYGMSESEIEVVFSDFRASAVPQEDERIRDAFRKLT